MTKKKPSQDGETIAKALIVATTTKMLGISRLTKAIAGSKIMTKEECREQIQEDIMTYVNPLLDNDYEFTNLNVDDLCQIVIDNFNKNLGGEFDRRREAGEKGLYND